MSAALDFEISFRDENASDVISIIDQVGGEDVKEVRQHGAFGIEVLILAVIAAEALASIVMKTLQLWKCGVVVDARGPRILTKKDCELPRGTVLVFTRDGTQFKLDRPSEFDIASLIGKALPRG
jgi:hypothetical protein